VEVRTAGSNAGERSGTSLIALEINDHARNRKLIWQGIVPREFVGNAASIAMRYPIAVSQLLWFRFQRIFAVEAR